EVGENRNQQLDVAFLHFGRTARRRGREQTNRAIEERGRAAEDVDLVRERVLAPVATDCTAQLASREVEQRTLQVHFADVLIHVRHVLHVAGDGVDAVL